MTTDSRIASFFGVVFQDVEGFVCVARRKPGTRTFDEDYFLFPSQLEALANYLDQFIVSHDLYFCPQVFSTTKRTKENVKSCPAVWADLDLCPPSQLLVPPTIAVETSPHRYQALWLKHPPFDPAEAEDISRRIAYYHAEAGADKSGWDLTQLLRVPYSYNHKYQIPTLPYVSIVSTNSTPIEDDTFDVYPEVEGFEYTAIPFPTDDLFKEPEDVLDSYKAYIHPNVTHLFVDEPPDDWSRSLWLLENYLFEAGLSREEVFVVCRAAACNKYKRDGKSEKLLWVDVCRAWANVQSKSDGVVLAPEELYLPDLLTPEESFLCEHNSCIVDEYVQWGKSVGDAAWQYHEAGGFIILSTLLGGIVRIPTSYGVVIPNLWFTILADTTLTRKTTAMDMATDVLDEIDSDTILATDGSIEGLMTSLSMRPGRPSIFLRDEVSGLIEQFAKKDYYAGMAETLTKLYDGKNQKRVLRKEIIEVRDPVLNFFAGGIQSRVLSLLTAEHVSSGFIPRFVFVMAESDIRNMKPLGPPTETSLAGRQKVVDRFKAIYHHYHRTETVTFGDKTISQPKRWEAKLTAQAWVRYNKFETDMLASVLKTENSDLLTPTFDRLTKSGLKIAALIAASRNLGGEVIIEVADIVKAFSFVEKWRYHSLKVVTGVGATPFERTLQRILKAVTGTPGIKRSTIMQNHHLSARDADLLFNTLEQRGRISRTKQGKAELLYPVLN